MKKFIIIFVSIMTAIVIACITLAIIIGINFGFKLRDAAVNYKKYDANNPETMNMQIYYNSASKKAFVGSVEVNNKNLDIVIPNNIGDIKINSLGGYHGTGVPTLFYIDYNPDYDLINDYFKCSKEDYEDKKNIYEITKYDVSINITLPKYLNTIRKSRFNYDSLEYYINPTEEKAIIFNISRKYNIDENNKYYYTKDGFIYNKKTNEIINY